MLIPQLNSHIEVKVKHLPLKTLLKKTTCCYSDFFFSCDTSLQRRLRGVWWWCFALCLLFNEQPWIKPRTVDQIWNSLWRRQRMGWGGALEPEECCLWGRKTGSKVWVLTLHEGVKNICAPSSAIKHSSSHLANKSMCLFILVKRFLNRGCRLQCLANVFTPILPH